MEFHSGTSDGPSDFPSKRDAPRGKHLSGKKLALEDQLAADLKHAHRARSGNLAESAALPLIRTGSAGVFGGVWRRQRS
jgi:hypothetical protein